MEGDLEFRLLGPFDAVADGVSVAPRSGRQRDLLVLLLLDANRVISTDALIERLWAGNPPPTATSALQVYIAKLRQLLAQHPEAASISTAGGGYSLEVAEDRIDAHRFERLALRGHDALERQSYREAASMLRSALDLWRGQALADVRHLDGAALAASRLEELRDLAVVDRIEAGLRSGKHAQLIPELETLVEEQPLRERFWEQLMLAQYLDGRQSEALRSYRRASDALGGELGIEPGPGLRHLEERILLQDPGLLVAASEKPPTNIRPRPSSFIGRTEELQRIENLIRSRPLVTLTGPGGAGKTRLALEAGERLLDHFPDGVWFVDLAPLSPGSGLGEAVLAALGLTEDTNDAALHRLAGFLDGRRTLLILDNCEHVLGGCVEFLARVPIGLEATSVLATSRQRINSPGEASWTVPPMSLPSREASLDESAASDAAALFLERALSRMPDLRLEEANVRAAVRICRRLDGLPLAIELAAARANVLSPAEIADRLEDRLGLLTRGDKGLPHRHVALRETIRWSYDLLDEREKELFERLSVFRGGFTLEAARHVGATGSITLDLVTGLVEKSLLQPEMVPDRATRYHSLETLREFGAERLEATGAAFETEERHRRFFERLAQDAAATVGGPDEALFFDRLEAEMDNLRVAFDHSAQRDPEAAVELAEALTTFWMHRGHAPEGRRLLDRLLHTSAELQANTRAAAEWTMGVLAYSVDDYASSRAHMESALQTEQDLGNPERIARILNGLGVLLLQAGNYSDACAHYERAQLAFEELGNERGSATALLNQGIAWLNLGDLATARQLFGAARERFEAVGDRREVAHCFLRLAFVAELEGDTDTALGLHRLALDMNRDLGNRLGIADSAQYMADAETLYGSPSTAVGLLLEALELFVDLDSPIGIARVMFTTAMLADRSGLLAEAAALVGAEEAIRTAISAPVPIANVEGHEELAQSLIDRLGPTDFEVRRTRGKLLGREQAIELTLHALHTAAQMLNETSDSRSMR